MADKIEAAFGTSVTFPENSSIGKANAAIKERSEKGDEILAPLVREFDSVIIKINSLEPSRVDDRLTPNLRLTLETLAQLNLKLPTLKELRENEDPVVRKRIDEVMSKVMSEMSNEDGSWRWLNEIQTPRLVISSLIIDGYNEIIRNDPRFNALGFNERVNAVGTTIEEASILFHPEFGINRAASKFYTREEGFTQDFIDFAQAIKLIEAGRMLKPDMQKRKNMNEVWKFIKENPFDVLDLMKTLNLSVKELNQMVQGTDIPVMLKNIGDSQVVVSKHPLPLFFGESETLMNLIRNLKIYRKALTITNAHMNTGESVNRVSELPTDIQQDLAFARFHVDVSDPKAIFAGLITHMVEYWTKENPAYKALGRDTMINALCEVIGYKHPDSELFKLLYDPEGLNWYAEGWGFEKKFLDYLTEKLKKTE